MPYHVFVVLLLILTGCSQTDTQRGLGEAELTRVARILDTELPPDITVDPRVRTEIAVPPFSEARIGFTKALSLGECGLVPLIAERNSALGRQKAASTRFIYEWRIWEGLMACQTQFADKSWFQTALLEKRLDVDIAVQAVLFQSIEADAVQSALAASFSDLKLSGAAYRDAWSRISPLLIQALKGGPSPTQAEHDAFEVALKHWGDTRHHAALGRAVRQTDAWLQAANALLQDAKAANRICPMGTPTAEGRQIAAFVRGYFASSIQSEVATVMQSVEGFEALWEPVRQASPTIAKAATTDALLLLSPSSTKALKQRWQVHVEGWQTILQQCQLAPRAETMN
jgi:hypothetical protein